MRLFALTLALGISVGCASASVQVCRDAARCAGEDASECVEDARAGNDEAAEAGCTSETNRLARCVERNSECDDGVYVTDLGACDEQLEDQLACFFDAAF